MVQSFGENSQTARRELEGYLRAMVLRGASDLFFSAGVPTHIKIEGSIGHFGERSLARAEIERLAFSVMTVEQREQFARRPEMNLGISLDGQGRFRINIYRQRGDVSMVVRHLREEIPRLDALNLPPILERLVMLPRGLVLVVGATGSGKSTTLASMIEHRNRDSASHILTIEDPIEYVHRSQRSLVEQREVGIDTHSYADALSNAMREAPDVILIGEIRDRETMQHAIAYAETGHLCLSTLHANNANQALERIITFFPESAHAQLFMDLSMNLRAIVSQRLVHGRDGRRLPALELLINSPLIADLIKKGAVDELRAAMERNSNDGSQTFDQALLALYRQHRISYDEAVRNAESANNLRLAIRLDESGSVNPPKDMSIAKDQ